MIIVNVCERENTQQEKLENIREIAIDRKMTAKQKFRESKDQKSKLRCFEEGNSVLRRAPEKRGKLNEGWDGPHVIYRRVSDINYEIIIPNRQEKRMIVHINNLKDYHQEEANVLRIIVATEDIAKGKKKKNCLVNT